MNARQPGNPDAGFLPGFNVANYSSAMQAYLEQYARSFEYAAMATVLALIIAYPLAYFIAFRSGRFKNFLLVLVGSVVLSFSGTFALSLAATLAVAAGMGLQNAIVFKLLPRYLPDAVGGASGWIGGLGALGGFVIPPVMGVVTGMVGGTAGYARGFLPFAVLVVLALPVVGLLSRWSSRNGHGLA